MEAILYGTNKKGRREVISLTPSHFKKVEKWAIKQGYTDIKVEQVDTTKQFK